MDRAKKIWEDHGANDAYFAVATYEEFRKGNLDAAAKEKFFQSGKDHVERLFSEMEKGFGIALRPARVLDYGCGVGRVLIPLADKCETVTGVDISQSMLDETRSNCSERRIENVILENADDFFAANSQRYDFVHSYIVLQHILPKTGEEIISKMVERLEVDGVGMVHITFFDRADAITRFRSRLYRDVPFVHRLLSRVRGKSASFMPMYEYDLNHVLRLLMQNGCGDVFVRFSDHGSLGALIFFRKSEAHTY